MMRTNKAMSPKKTTKMVTVLTKKPVRLVDPRGLSPLGMVTGNAMVAALIFKFLLHSAYHNSVFGSTLYMHVSN